VFAGIRVIAIVTVAVFVIAACIALSVRELVARCTAVSAVTRSR
jgi:hypothetical protein